MMMTTVDFDGDEGDNNDIETAAVTTTTTQRRNMLKIFE